MHAIPDSLRHQVDAIGAIFNRADEATKDFASRSGLSCPPGCGACCDNPAIEATVGELLPLALEIVALGKEEEFHARAAAGIGTHCILFKQVGLESGRGRCMLYKHRPLLCRMFGYAGVRSHDGKVALAACKVHKSTHPEEVKSAPQPPLIANYAMESFAACDVAGLLAVERLPINEAIMRAIEYVALRVRIEGEAALA